MHTSKKEEWYIGKTCWRRQYNTLVLLDKAKKWNDEESWGNIVKKFECQKKS